MLLYLGIKQNLDQQHIKHNYLSETCCSWQFSDGQLFGLVWCKKKKKQYKLQKALSHLPKQDISDTPSGIQWSRNLECFTLAELSPSSINLDLKDTGNERSLGILWNSCKNSFQIKVFKMEVPLTKKERFQATPVPSLICLVFWLLLYWNQKS